RSSRSAVARIPLPSRPMATFRPASSGTDFTIVIERRNLKHFVDRGRRLVELAGKRVRVRGWLKRRNGPMITVTHPEQIEILER
ncbi:MAG: hypothetical protein P8Y15_16660, partial [Gemmatimonadales bacterium]